MTNPDTLPAGPELDVLVAERVMALPPEKWQPPCFWRHRTDEAEYDSEFGWGGWCYTCGKMIENVVGQPRAYSIDIAAAWEVVEKLGGQVYSPKPVEGAHTRDKLWSACLWTPTREWGEWGYGETAPLAICRAALTAIGAL